MFDNNIYYHIYNRGVDKRRVFLDGEDFARFLLALKEYNTVKEFGALRDWLFYKNSHRSHLWRAISRDSCLLFIAQPFSSVSSPVTDK